MVLPNLPALDSTDWYPWAQGVHRVIGDGVVRVVKTTAVWPSRPDVKAVSWVGVAPRPPEMVELLDEWQELEPEIINWNLARQYTFDTAVEMIDPGNRFTVGSGNLVPNTYASTADNYPVFTDVVAVAQALDVAITALTTNTTQRAASLWINAAAADGTTALSGYLLNFWYLSPTRTFQLQRWENGTGTTLQTVSQDVPAGTPQLRLEHDGVGVVKAWVDRSSVDDEPTLMFNDPNPLQGARSGLRFNNSGGSGVNASKAARVGDVKAYTR